MNEILVEQIREKVKKADQEHILRYWESLSTESQAKLIKQVSSFDFDLLQHLAQKYILNPYNRHFHGELEPADIIPIPKTDEEMRKAQEAMRVGEHALREGKIAALLVAGGQSTRLGLEGPKGKFPVGPVSGKSLFQFHAEKIKAIERKYNTVIPWYIMTSEANDLQTKTYFEENEYLGLTREQVFFFTQGMMPALNAKGKLILDAKDHVFTNPNGHGGCLSALKQSGALEDMRRRGIREIFYFQVDNVLVKICDPVFIGYHLMAGAEMSAKVVPKKDAYEKVGIIGRLGGRLRVIEYSDLSKEDMEATNPDGSLKYNGGNIAIHILNVDFVEKENEGGLKLPYHVAHKRIPYLNEEGQLIQPEEPNGYKFETFVFDALGDAERSVIMEVKREEEFSPIKNAEGEDSPATARRDLIAYYARMLEVAGVQIPRDPCGNILATIEISPLFALDEEELKQRIPPHFTLAQNQKVYLKS